VAQGVVEEKSSRVVELLLATIRPWELMAGKVIGIGLLGLANIHQAAVDALINGKALDEPRKLDKAHQFLIESMSPFEMMQIGNRESNAALRRLNGILEDEAKRIAHTLHDEAAQLLASVYLELAEIQRQMPPKELRRHVDKIAEHLDQVKDQLRRLSHELRPPILDQLGVLPALQFLSDGFRKRAGLTIVLDNAMPPDRGRLPPQIETALYRAVQEALNNVVRHAEAKHVWIRIWMEQQMICCTVRDDGRGFPVPADMEPGQHGLGLMGIRERISSLYGAFEVDSEPGSGTELKISIPLGSNL